MRAARSCAASLSIPFVSTTASSSSCRRCVSSAWTFARLPHVEPETPATEHVIADVVEQWKPTLAIIDAAAGAYDLQGLDDHKRQDVEAFSRAIVDPFRRGGVATLVLDHVTKNADTR